MAAGLKYCKKCGGIAFVGAMDTGKCFCCNSPFFSISDEYLDEDRMLFKKGLEERFIKEVIETNGVSINKWT